MNHPDLSTYNSPNVKNLLLNFYSKNFQKAGIGYSYGQNIIKTFYDGRDNSTSEALREEINKLFNNARDLKTSQTKELDPIELIDFADVKTFLDYGANKLDALNKVATRYTNVEKLIAIDVIPQSRPFLEPSKSQYLQVTSNENWTIKPESVDLINIQFVLHHVESLEVITSILTNAFKALKTGGKLVLWEETFENLTDIKELVASNQRLNIQTDFDLTQEFNNLSDLEKWEFIIINDWIINVNNPHMQWSMQYRTWEDWVNILSKHGFSLQKQHNLGLRINARVKQGVHMIGEFTRRKI